MKGLPFEAVLAARLSRRSVRRCRGRQRRARGVCGNSDRREPRRAARIRFNGIAPQNNDAFVIADGYRFNVVARWGDSLVAGTPDFDTRRMTNTDWLNAARGRRAEPAVRHQLRCGAVLPAGRRAAPRAGWSA